MAAGEQKPESKPRGAAAERGARFLRNINVLGALAIGGAAIIAPPVAAAGLGVWAGVNAAQAAGFEVARRHFAKKGKQ